MTTHLFPLSVSGSVQAHLVNIDWLNSLPAETRAKFEAAMAGLEAGLWDLAATTNGVAQACSTGGDCPEGGLYTSYKMTLVPVSDADKAKVAEIALAKVLPAWAARCEAGFAGCTTLWNDTIGKARGLTIK